jgi:hypothetical protein
MSLDIEQAKVSIQSDFQIEDPIERNTLAVLDLDKSSDFEELFRAPPATWRALVCSDCPLHVELSTLRCDKGYWRKRHQKAVERESQLKQEIAELKGKLRIKNGVVNNPEATVMVAETTPICLPKRKFMTSRKASSAVPSVLFHLSFSLAPKIRNRLRLR